MRAKTWYMQSGIPAWLIYWFWRTSNNVQIIFLFSWFERQLLLTLWLPIEQVSHEKYKIFWNFTFGFRGSFQLGRSFRYKRVIQIKYNYSSNVRVIQIWGSFRLGVIQTLDSSDLRGPFKFKWSFPFRDHSDVQLLASADTHLPHTYVSLQLRMQNRRRKWNFPLNFCTMRKLSECYSGIFQIHFK